jgi:hypothetical protein
MILKPRNRLVHQTGKGGSAQDRLDFTIRSG